MSRFICVIEDEVVEMELDNYSDYQYKGSNGNEYCIFKNSEIAGKAAREYWEDMAKNDLKEFLCIIGEKALIAWGLGQYYAVGSTAVNSLEGWLDLSLDHPEEHFASYDGEEIEIFQMNKNMQQEFGSSCVAYRSN